MDIFHFKPSMSGPDFFDVLAYDDEHPVHLQNRPIPETNPKVFSGRRPPA
jgi:hypothetical protein